MRSERLADILDALDVGILRMKLDGTVLSHNPQMAEIIGNDCAAFDRSSWLQLFHPDDAVTVLQVMERAAHPDDDFLASYVARVRVQGGDFHWMRVAYCMEIGSDGDRQWLTLTAPLTLAGIQSDVKRMMRENGIRYRALFDHASDALLLIHKGRIVDCNDAALSMFRVARRDMVGQSTGAFARSHADLDEVRAVLAKQGVHQARVGISRHDGTYFESESRMVRVEIDGEVFVLNAIRDITEQLDSEREREQMLEVLAERNESLQWLQQASAQLFAQPTMDTLGAAAITLLDQHYSSACAYVSLIEGAVMRTIARSPARRIEHVRYVSPRFQVWDRVAAAPHRMLVIDDLEQGLRDMPGPLASLKSRGVTTLVLVLLLDGERELGAVVLEYYDTTPLPRHSLNELQVFTHTLALALARAEHLSAIAFQAEHDALTGLYNRSVLHREFDDWLPERDARAVLFLLDLDRFKEINDTLGHHVGDDLLRQIGSRLRLGLSYRDAVVCRLGGDEFAVMLLGQHTDTDAAVGLGRELVSALRRPFLINGVQLEISASVGVALYPEHGVDSHALLRSADVAMYEAKRSGAGVLSYESRLDMHSPERLRLIVDLGNGIRERELLLHYQPKLDLRSGRVVGCEALVRWQHPQQGLLGPDRFIPFAEMSDTIHVLTAYVIDEACRQQRLWRAENIDLSVAVNLSARNLIDDRIVNHIERAIRDYAVPAGALELEITETTLMHDPARAVQLLERITALGVRLSVDDFGTGYSSLAYLRRLPIDTLKIDRTFVSEMLSKTQDVVIVQSIVALAHNLDLKVVAEGVETAEVLDSLAVMGCDQAQGYLLSRPLHPAQVPIWLRQFSQPVRLAAPA